jgi:effector-binding domain-containing protein
MRIFKYFFFILILLLIAAAVYLGTKEGSFELNVQRTMKVPPSLLFKTIETHEGYTNWGMWTDRQVEVYISDFVEDSTGYSGITWTANELGEVSVINTAKDPDRSITQQVQSESGKPHLPATLYWELKTIETGLTELSLKASGQFSFMDKVKITLGQEDYREPLIESMQTTLRDLEVYLLERMSAYSIDIAGITSYGGGYYLFVTSAAKLADRGDKMAPMMNTLSRFAKENNIGMAGMPFTIFNEFDQTHGNVIFSAAIPVNDRVITPSGSDVLCRYMEPVTALKVVLAGNYDYLQKAYEAGLNHIQRTSGIVKDPDRKMFEVYRNDPGLHPNPAEWITDIYLPVLRLPVQTDTP